jgi:predicted anti-sigma-YlaC factor YlaD
MITMHTEYTMLMSVALDDETTPAEQQRLRDHLRTCTACSGVWERWQAVDRRFDAAPLITPSATFADTVMARIEAQALKPQRARWLNARLAVSLLAAGLLIALVLTGLLVYWGAQNPAHVSNAFFAVLRGVGAAAWVFLGILRLMGGVGAPTLAAGVGLLATLTCLFSILWLWVVGRGGHVAAVDPVMAS